MTPRRKLRQSAIRLRDALSRISRLRESVRRDLNEVVATGGHGSSAKLAEEIGISASHLHDMRHGNRGFTEATVEALARIEIEKEK